MTFSGFFSLIKLVKEKFIFLSWQKKLEFFSPWCCCVSTAGLNSEKWVKMTQTAESLEVEDGSVNHESWCVVLKTNWSSWLCSQEQSRKHFSQDEIKFKWGLIFTAVNCDVNVNVWEKCTCLSLDQYQTNKQLNDAFNVTWKWENGSAERLTFRLSQRVSVQTTNQAFWLVPCSSADDVTMVTMTSSAIVR